MRALTLWPEWAWAVRWLGKRVENRPWGPPAGLVGRELVLHAGRAFGGRRGMAVREAMYPVMAAAHAAGWTVRDDGRWITFVGPRGASVAFALPEPHVGQLQSNVAVGAVFGVVRVVGLDHEDGVAWGLPGQRHWKLAGARWLRRPIPARGRQGLWTLPAAALPPLSREHWVFDE